MIVTCPSCQTRYRAEPEALSRRGGKVRCNVCAHVWTVQDEAVALTEPVSEPAPAPRPAPKPRPAPEPADAEAAFAAAIAKSDPTVKPHAAIRERAERRRRAGRLAAEGAGWAAVAAVFALVFAGAWLFRLDVVDAFPPASRAYAMAGIEINPLGLEVRGLEASYGEGDEAGALVIEGVVQNVTGRSRSALPMRAALLDEAGEPLVEWMIVLESDSLPPRGAERFRTVISDPPRSAAQLDVTFRGPEARLAARGDEGRG